MSKVRRLQECDLPKAADLALRLGFPKFHEEALRQKKETGLYGLFGIAQPLLAFALLRKVVPQAELHFVAVEPGERRRGLASELLRGVLAELAQAGCSHLDLEVSEQNDPAIQLYRKLGFGFIETRRQYYADGSDALLMRRSLP